MIKRVIVLVTFLTIMSVASGFALPPVDTVDNLSGAAADSVEGAPSTLGDLPADIREKIVRHVEQDMYRINRSEGTLSSGHTYLYQAFNRKQGLSAHFGGEGVYLQSTSKHTGSWEFWMRLSGCGYPGKVKPVDGSGKQEIEATGSRLVYQRGFLTEWYENTVYGLEQGLTLQQPPASASGREGVLRIEWMVSTSMFPKVTHDGSTLSLYGKGDERVLDFKGLKAWDALGKILSSRMELSKTGDSRTAYSLSYLVSDKDAVYPITIDPTFSQAKKLLPHTPDGAAFDWFGFSVALSGDTALVGAISDDANGGNSGSAYVFQRDQGGTDNWGQVAKITPDDGAGGDGFGASVSISGGTALVGAPGDDNNGSGSGSAYVFQRNLGGTDNWGQIVKITPDDGAEGDNFGWSVSLSGDTALVGAYLDDDNGSGSGSAYVFQRDQGGADNWGQIAKITPDDGAEGDHFGWSVSLSGDTALVAAHGIKNGYWISSAYIFRRDQGGADNWGQVAKITPDDGAAGHFGASVSLSGDTAMVGAHADDDNGDWSGSVYVFQRDQGGADNWGQVAKITPDDGAAQDEFGWSVSISGDTALVGAPGDDNNGSGSGSAYVFQRNQGGTDNWGQLAKITPDDGAEDDNFGASVSISGDTALVGAFLDDDNGSGSGSAYVFNIKNNNIKNKFPWLMFLPAMLSAQ